MSPRLRVLAGTSPDTMVPITSLVNTSKAHSIQSDLFQGQIVVNIKGMTDEHGRVRNSEYFEREERQGVTWSIQVQGRFLAPVSADDILFGNTFDRPLKLPWGTSAILKFMHYIDPTLEHDLLSSTKPWALSPLICTMPHFMHTRVPSCSAASTQRIPGQVERSKTFQLPPFPPAQSIKDSTDELYLAMIHGPCGSSGSSPASSASSLSSGRSIATSYSSGRSVIGGSLRIKEAVKKVGKKRKEPSINAEVNEVRKFEGAAQRRSYFSSATKRQDIQFGPMDVITTDFCYGFINFAPSLSLQLPGGLSLDLMKYWDGQPVRFVCCERTCGDGRAGEPWGRVFWCVAIEVVDVDEG